MSNPSLTEAVIIAECNWDSRGLTDPYQLDIAFGYDDIKFPRKLLYDDLGCKIPSATVDLRGLPISRPLFELMSKACSKHVVVLRLDKCVGLDQSSLELIRGFPKLTTLSLAGMEPFIPIFQLTIDTPVAKLLATLSALTDLNISGCKVNHGSVSIIMTSCIRLTTLTCRNCPGLDDFCMQSIAASISKFRRLCHLDFSHSTTFSDDGALTVIIAGPNVIKSLSFAGCKNLSSLSITGLRNKMAVLESLDISRMPHMTQSAFEFIGEGCSNLKIVDLSNSNEVDDAAVVAIGKKCQLLERMNLARCTRVTDIGMAGFFEYCNARLTHLDITGCIQCGGVTTFAISTKAEKLINLKLNGLSMVTEKSLQALLNQAKELSIFEMQIVLRSVTTHRRSMMPHISDSILKESNYHKLSQVKLSGAALVSDVGVIALIHKCQDTLTLLDVSYCNCVTDKTLAHLAVKIKDRLTSLKVTGCNKITNLGVIALTHGCRRILELELNGCAKVTNDGVMAIANKCKWIEILGIRNLDMVTDDALILLAQKCRHLKSLEIGSLDFVTIKSIKELTTRCKKLTTLNCESCNFTSRDFASTVATRLPLCEASTGRCHLQPRIRVIHEYNRYVVNMREMDFYARVLQKLCKLIYRNASIFRHRRNCRAAMATIIRVYKEYALRKRKVILKRQRNQRHRAAKVLQRWTRHCLGIGFAVNKVDKVRSEKHARELIQRAYRGHMVRKRVGHRFQRIYMFYQKFGILVHKYVVICAARRLHRQILKAQSVVRMYNRKLDFYFIRKGAVALQLRMKNWLKRRQAIKRTLYGSIISVIERRHNAANTIRKLWRDVKFNTQMSPFILVCAIWHRMEYDTHTWNAIVIQRYWRGFIIRLKKWRVESLPGRMFMGATKLQSLWRMYKVHNKMYPSIRIKKKKYLRKWRHFLVNSLPRLRLGRFTKRIQRFYRIYWFICFKDKFANMLLHRWKGYKVRKAYLKVIYDIRNRAAGIIARKFRRRKAYFWRRERMAREHMAARKIQRKQKTSFNIESIRRINLATSSRLRKEAVARKEKMLIAKRMRIFDKIKANFMFMYATRIQRAYRRHVQAVIKKEEAERRRKELLAQAKEEEIQTRNAKFFAKLGLPNPVVVAKKVSAAASQLAFGEKELIPEDDLPRFQNAILKYQTKSILQEGFVNIHLTVGEGEYTVFLLEQTQLKTSKQPYYEVLPGDLSGNRLALEVYLWVRRGRGNECITHFEIKEKPAGLSLNKLRERASHSSANGIKIAWHPHLPIEIHGHQTILQGIGGFAVSDLKILLKPAAKNDRSEEEKLAMKGYRVVERLYKYGFDTSIFMLARRVVEDDDIYKYGTLNAMDWMDDKVRRLVQAFNLSESDVYAIKRTFDYLASNTNPDILLITALFEHMALPQTQVSKWAIEALKPTSKGELTFREYLHFVCYFTMFSRKDLCKFIFGCMDTEKNQFLRKETFFVLVDFLAEGSGRSSRVWQLQWDNYSDPRLNTMFPGGFERFVLSNPSTLWQAQDLQRRLMSINIGEVYWDNKIEQFRVMRKEIGVKLF